MSDIRENESRGYYLGARDAVAALSRKEKGSTMPYGALLDDIAAAEARAELAMEKAMAPDQQLAEERWAREQGEPALESAGELARRALLPNLLPADRAAGTGAWGGAAMGLSELHHRDGDPLNNELSNLEIRRTKETP